MVPAAAPEAVVSPMADATHSLEPLTVSTSAIGAQGKFGKTGVSRKRAGPRFRVLETEVGFEACVFDDHAMCIKSSRCTYTIWFVAHTKRHPQFPPNSNRPIIRISHYSLAYTRHTKLLDI